MAVRLDREAIQALQLDITAASVKAAICAAPRLRVKPPQITCAGEPTLHAACMRGQSSSKHWILLLPASLACWGMMRMQWQRSAV